MISIIIIRNIFLCTPRQVQKSVFARSHRVRSHRRASARGKRLSSSQPRCDVAQHTRTHAHTHACVYAHRKRPRCPNTSIRTHERVSAFAVRGCARARLLRKAAPGWQEMVRDKIMRSLSPPHRIRQLSLQHRLARTRYKRLLYAPLTERQVRAHRPVDADSQPERTFDVRRATAPAFGGTWQ